jgi:hypothetical protein
MTEFERIRKGYVNSLIKGEYPVLPAFYFYAQHTKSKDVLSPTEFNKMFMDAVADKEENNYITMNVDVYPAAMSIQEVMRILDGYFGINILHNKEGEIIKIY